MQLMNCLANFGPLRLVFNCMKPCYGKTVDLGGVFCPFGGLVGVPGVTAGRHGFLGRA